MKNGYWIKSENDKWKELIKNELELMESIKYASETKQIFFWN